MRVKAWASIIVGLWMGATAATNADELRPVPLKSRITTVQPMTGIVLWTTNEAVETAPIQLEYSYLAYGQVVSQRGEYDWTPVDNLLKEVAGRKHQAILRWYDTYVGKPTGVPAYVQALPGYRGLTAKSENKPTGFPDWSHPELRRFTLEFFEKFAERYDRDPRLAFVQVGFGLWSEYHVYDGPMKLGQTFPSLEYQREFALRLNEVFRQTPWMISVDAAGDHAPFARDSNLLAVPFGVFDDSFNHARHSRENEPNWDALGRDRWKRAPAGGEFSFFEPRDQKQALAPKGPHGIPFEQHAARFHVSFMIGDGQPQYQKPDRIREAGQACGYRFRITHLEASDRRAVVRIENGGVAPLYYDAYVVVDGQRGGETLKGLLPSQSRTIEIPISDTKVVPMLTIESERLVPGQRIEFEADLP